MQGFLRDLAVILAASFPVLWAGRKMRLPPIVAFLVTGAILGPHVLAVLRDTVRVEAIAEFGVVLILFFVGLEFPVGRLLRLGRTAFLGGSLQMLATAGAMALLGLLFGAAPNVAVFYGLLVSLSSTAVLLPLLAERDELTAPYGRTFLAVALFQDLAVIPLVLLLPALAAGAARPSLGAVLARVGVAVVGVAVLVAVARFVAPRVLDGFVRLGRRETFTGGVVVIVLAMIAAAGYAGVSAALGAFAAGIVLGESDHVHEVAAALAPFRDILSSLFFVSVGMLLDPLFLVRHAGVVAGLLVAILAIKTATAHAALRASGSVPRTAFRAALGLATVGEFSFVLAGAARGLGILSGDAEQAFVAVAFLTMALAPLLVAAGPRLSLLLPDHPETLPVEEGPRRLTRHILIVGAGLNGTNVARILQETGIPYALLDLDPDRVAAARREGLYVLRADGTGPEGLEAAGVDRALGAVITIPDPGSARRAVRLCRARNPGLRLIVRTRYVREVDALRACGADEVIPEEFETSIEIVARVLQLLHVPGNVVATQIRLLRDEAYQHLRDPFSKVAGGRRLSALVAAGTTELFLVMPETAAEGRTLAELDLGAMHVAVPALLRDGAPYAPPPLDMRVAGGDTLLLVGAHEDLVAAIAKLGRGASEATGEAGTAYGI